MSAISARVQQSLQELNNLHELCVQDERGQTLLPQPDAYQDLKTQIEDKQNHPEAMIMVYGVYNAGKSTLINALLGREEAPTGDVPLTAEIKAYHWDRYDLIDSPGLDSSRHKDDALSEATLQKADAVIFVVNPRGVSQEVITLNKMMQLIYQRKKVFVVFNRKDQFSDEAFFRIKDQTMQLLQEAARNANLNLGNALNDLPMYNVNLKTACKGRFQMNTPELATKRDLLLDKCGYTILENGLRDFLGSLKLDDSYKRLAQATLSYVGHIQNQCTVHSADDNLKLTLQFQNDANSRMEHCKIALRNRLNTTADAVACDVKSTLFQNVQQGQGSSEQLQTKVKQIVDNYFQQFSAEVEDEVKALISFLQTQADNAVQKIATINAMQVRQSDFSMSGDEPVEATKAESLNLGTGLDLTQQGLGVIATTVKPELIVGGLQVVKRFAPTLMKGIGPVTMGKIASTVVGRVLPGIGTAITVISTLYSIFGKDSQEEIVARQAAEQQEQYERYCAQVENYAKEVRTDFVTTFENYFTNELDPLLEETRATIEKALQIKQGDQQYYQEVMNCCSKISSVLKTVLEKA